MLELEKDNDYRFIPSIEISNAVYGITDINTTSWNNLWDSESSSISDYNDYESNDIVSFICSNTFSNCSDSDSCVDNVLNNLVVNQIQHLFFGQMIINKVKNMFNQMHIIWMHHIII